MAGDIKVLGIKIDNVDMQHAVAKCERFIESASPHIVATANAEMIMLAQSDKELANILNNADLVVADGAGVVWAAKHQGTPLPERVAGYDLLQELLKKAAIKGYKVFFFGSAPGIAERAKIEAETKYPGVTIVGVRNGFFSNDDEHKIIEEINMLEPDMLFVALGVPKQEKWIYKHRDMLKVPVIVGVGGSFDVMAKAVKRAPLWMQKARLEWFFRLCMQPSRAGRMMALPRFVLKVLNNKKD